MALARRRPAAALVHHSDRGSQYTARAYQALLADQRITVSMSRAGDCYDNALAESFFATLKCELLDQQSWSTRGTARQAIFAWIEGFYNRRRLHSSLGYLSPAAFEEADTTVRLAAYCHAVHETGATPVRPGIHVSGLRRALWRLDSVHRHEE